MWDLRIIGVPVAILQDNASVPGHLLTLRDEIPVRPVRLSVDLDLNPCVAIRASAIDESKGEVYCLSTDVGGNIEISVVSRTAR